MSKAEIINAIAAGINLGSALGLSLLLFFAWKAIKVGSSSLLDLFQSLKDEDDAEG